MKSTLEYPLNALEEAINYFEGEPINYKFPNGVNGEQINGVLYVIDKLQDKHRDVIVHHYKNSRTIQEIADDKSVTKNRVYQYLHMAFKDLLTSPYKRYIWDGIDMNSINGNALVSIKDLELSGRVINALHRASIYNVNDVFEYVEKYGIDQFASIRCFGKVSYKELQAALSKLGLVLEDYYDRD